MESKIVKKREKEIKIISLMVRIYCRGNKHTCYKNGLFSVFGEAETILCEECTKLLEYAIDRTKKCPFMETKTFCSNCKVHCYNKPEREKIKRVMRYAGPRLILYHPVLIIKHLFKSKKEILADNTQK